MSKAKSKYSPEETIALVTAWGFSTDSGVSTTGLTIPELMAKFANKWNERELRAKLSHEGRYKARPKTKTGKPAIRKDALSTIIGNLCDMAEPDASSLEKSNKGALEKIVSTIEALTEALNFYEATAEEVDEDEETELSEEDAAEIVTELNAEESEDSVSDSVESGDVEPDQTA